MCWTSVPSSAARRSMRRAAVALKRRSAIGRLLILFRVRVAVVGRGGYWRECCRCGCRRLLADLIERDHLRLHRVEVAARIGTDRIEVLPRADLVPREPALVDADRVVAGPRPHVAAKERARVVLDVPAGRPLFAGEQLAAELLLDRHAPRGDRGRQVVEVRGLDVRQVTLAVVADLVRGQSVEPGDLDDLELPGR